MYIETRATTINGTIILENQTVVNMYAQKSESGDVSMNVNIQSPTLYNAYKEECDRDIAAFKAHVEEL